MLIAIIPNSFNIDSKEVESKQMKFSNYSIWNWISVITKEYFLVSFDYILDERKIKTLFNLFGQAFVVSLNVHFWISLNYKLLPINKFPLKINFIHFSSGKSINLSKITILWLFLIIMISFRKDLKNIHISKEQMFLLYGKSRVPWTTLFNIGFNVTSLHISSKVSVLFWFYSRLSLFMRDMVWLRSTTWSLDWQSI